jgi:hypothetical protein
MTLNLNNNAKQFLRGQYSYVLATLRFAILLLSRAYSHLNVNYLPPLSSARAPAGLCSNIVFHTTVISRDPQKEQGIYGSARVFCILPSNQLKRH